ncbi:MAG: helix-turn-helix domain-containing protein [Anaerolineae bacterium]
MNPLIQQVQVGIDFIEANLDHDITLAQVAQTADISQWHFQRIFKALTNETLKTYIRSRRLANALDKLLDPNIRIIDIAFEAGFESQEAFTRAFKKVYEMTPNAFRKLANKNLFLKKVQFDTDYLQNLKHNISLEPEIYVQPKLELIGLRTVFYSVDSEKNNIAEKLPPLWDAFLKRIIEINGEVPTMCYGIIRQTAEKTDKLEYFAATELKSLKQVPTDADLVRLQVPKTTYAKFACKGQVANLDDTVNYAYSSWLLQSEKKHTYGADIEFYGPEYEADSVDSTVYYAIPIT